MRFWVTNGSRPEIWNSMGSHGSNSVNTQYDYVESIIDQYILSVSEHRSRQKKWEKVRTMGNMIKHQIWGYLGYIYLGLPLSFQTNPYDVYRALASIHTASTNDSRISTMDWRKTEQIRTKRLTQPTELTVDRSAQEQRSNSFATAMHGWYWNMWFGSPFRGCLSRSALDTYAFEEIPSMNINFTLTLS